MNLDKIFLARLEDYIYLAEKTNKTVYTDFINPIELSASINLLDKNKNITYLAMGGHDNCERKLLCINSIYSDDIVDNDFIQVVKIMFDKYNIKWINHRNVLGAILGLGIERKVIGDILINDLTAYVFATKNITQFICDNLLSVGNASVTTSYSNISNIQFPQVKGVIKKLTVSSLRIDCILSSALNLPRKKSVELIKSDLVFANWRLVNKSTHLVKENEIITIRKKGRIILKSIGSKSSKDRTWVELECFI